MTDSFALYKLIILYMLKKVDFPLTTAQISEFILDKGYTSFFKLQETLSEMLESRLGQNRRNPQPYPLSSDRKRRRDRSFLSGPDLLLPFRRISMISWRKKLTT